MARKSRTGSKTRSKLRTSNRPISVSGNLSESVSIIGAGRLGTALALALAEKGYPIQTIVSRNVSGARRAARLIGPGTLALSSVHLTKLAQSTIIFITTPDDEIEDTANRLSTAIAWSGRGHVALHASGALSSESLSSLRAVGFQTGSMHPLMSVSDPQLGAESLKLAHFCIEGQSAAVRVARSMVRNLGGKSFSIHTRDKALYHAAALMSSGHMVALFDIVIEMLMRCGLTRREATDALLPLLTSTVENLAVHSPARALTGTFARADLATVRKHIAALNANGDSDELEAYKLLGLRSLKLAGENKTNIVNLKRIKHILEEITSSVD